MSLIIDGTAKSDVITGTSGDDTINSGAGNDAVTAGDGNDVVSGGDGNDRLDGGNGNDVLRGDAGNDRLYGGDGYDILYGDSGNDWLWGGANDDVLYGDLGNDALFGESGDDVMRGGAGDDRLDGGAGNDTVQGDEGDDLLFASEGNDNLYGGDGIDTVSYAKIQGKVFVFLDMPDAPLTGKGMDGPKSGTPPIFGMDMLNGIENVIGSSFDDVIFGNFSANRLEGGEGNDLLAALGNDTLAGGSGSDIFAFVSENSGDLTGEAWITDFSAVEGDKIDLTRLGIETPELLNNPNFGSIQELGGQTDITVYPDGVNFLIGTHVIHVIHSDPESPALQTSDFYFG